MRLHYCSDLHLEAQSYPDALPSGETLLIAGDLCHARSLEADPADGYAAKQRERILRFMDEAHAKFPQIIVVLGNHDHYDGVLEDTAGIFRRALGVTVLENEVLDVGGIQLFGATLWSDFEGRDAEAMRRAGKGCGEFFFVKTRGADGSLARFRTPNALTEHDRTLAALREFLSGTGEKIVVTHHAPSLMGLNPMFTGNGLDGAYASALDALIEDKGPRLWVHAHTHIRRKYRIGATDMRVNCLGFRDKDPCARGYAMASVDLP